MPIEKPLRIGIDGDALRTPMSGVGQYVYQICAELESLLPNASFFAYSRLPAARLALPSARWTLRQERVSWFRKVPSFAWLKTRGAALCREDQLDVFWAGRTLRPNLHARTKTVCTVHDLNHLLVPDTMELPTLWSNRLWFRRDFLSANVVVSNSEGTSQRLLESYGRSADVVVHPGVHPRFRPMPKCEREAAFGRLAALKVKPPYVLYVGTLEPRKNLHALLEANQQLRARGVLPHHDLVVVGAKGWQG